MIAERFDDRKNFFHRDKSSLVCNFVTIDRLAQLPRFGVQLAARIAKLPAFPSSGSTRRRILSPISQHRFVDIVDFSRHRSLTFQETQRKVIDKKPFGNFFLVDLSDLGDCPHSSVSFARIRPICCRFATLRKKTCQSNSASCYRQRNFLTIHPPNQPSITEDHQR